MAISQLDTAKTTFFDFLSEIEPILSTFVVWLDERVAEYKMFGHMKLDISADGPKWLKDYHPTKTQRSPAKGQKQARAQKQSKGQRQARGQKQPQKQTIQPQRGWPYKLRGRPDVQTTEVQQTEDDIKKEQESCVTVYEVNEAGVATSCSEVPIRLVQGFNVSTDVAHGDDDNVTDHSFDQVQEEWNQVVFAVAEETTIADNECEFDGASDTSATTAVSEVMSEMPYGDTPSLCELCGQNFTRKDNLARHMRMHTGDMFSCHICGRLFYTESTREEHIDTQHNNITYKCEYELCDKQYKSKYGLKLHLSTHTQTQKHCCTQCPARFTGKSLLLAHVSSKHEGVKLFGCDTCKKRFSHPSHMSWHKKICQVKTKPFKCQICDKTFKTTKYLKEHKSTMHGGKSNVCITCGQCFNSRGGLYTHERRKHGLEGAQVEVSSTKTEAPEAPEVEQATSDDNKESEFAASDIVNDSETAASDGANDSETV